MAHIQRTIKQRAKQPLSVDLNAEDERAEEEVPQIDALYQMSPRDVATYGFISHKALVPIGIVGSVLSQNDYYRDQFVEFVSGFDADLVKKPVQRGMPKFDQLNASDGDVGRQAGQQTHVGMQVFVWLGQCKIMQL